MSDTTITIILVAVGFSLPVIFLGWAIIIARQEMRKVDYHMRCLMGGTEWKARKAERDAETLPFLGIEVAKVGAVAGFGAMLFGARLDLPHDVVLALELSSPVGCVVFGLTLLLGRSMRKRAAAMRHRDRAPLVS